MDYKDEFLIRAKFGDNQAKEDIVECFMPLVISTLKRYYILNEDFIQELILKILECIEDFNPERNIPFIAYLKTVLRYRALELMREREFLSLDRENEEGDSIKDMIPDLCLTEEDFIKNETRKELKRGIEKLLPYERTLINLYYYRRLREKDAAKVLKISERTFRNHKKNILKKLKNEF